MVRRLTLIKTPLFTVLRQFASNAYWSSTQSSTDNAWNQNFNDGGQYSNNNKNNNIGVRCVRGFKQKHKENEAGVDYESNSRFLLTTLLHDAGF